MALQEFPLFGAFNRYFFIFYNVEVIVIDIVIKRMAFVGLCTRLEFPITLLFTVTCKMCVLRLHLNLKDCEVLRVSGASATASSQRATIPKHNQRCHHGNGPAESHT